MGLPWVQNHDEHFHEASRVFKSRSMSTLLLSHSACLNHLTPAGHPERPDRLRAIEPALEDEKFQSLARVEAPLGSVDIIALCHPIDYIEAIRDASPTEGLVRLDADTAMSPGSFEAALRAVGGAKLAVDEVMTGNAANAFVATRPPGHHTETARPMGFCLFNNAAIAARYAQKTHGVERAAVVDFEVHHGNGSQEFFCVGNSARYCSTHCEGIGCARTNRWKVEVGRYSRRCEKAAFRAGDRRAGIDRQTPRRGQSAARGIGRHLRTRRGAQKTLRRTAASGRSTGGKDHPRRQWQADRQ